MKRLSLEELKTQKVIANLDAIRGGNAVGCHNEDSDEGPNKIIRGK